ncbi:MAG: homocysteine S-methyltransferase family protein [Desulfovibrionaceae bacterium]|nr:homocysteine S-methyltransferase family protein [Desulfovibrionaceae bacterium]
MPNFRTALAAARPILFDGGMGTLLQAKGMPAGQSPELFGMAHPEVVRACHAEYVAAGAHVVTTNTFGGSPYKLHGEDARPVNRELAAAARAAAGDAVFVAGSVGPTGVFCRPLGEATFRDLVEAFKQQIQGLAEGGVDLILAETHFDLAEIRAVVVAAREVCDLPVGASMTFENGVSLTGTTPAVFVDTMQNMGVELIGTNCSTGPEGMLDVVRSMLGRLETPLLAEPNAGLPVLEGERTVFPMGPEEFASHARGFLDAGVRCLGGCCGTTPTHIARLVAAVGDALPAPLSADVPGCLTATSRAASAPVAVGLPCAIIGERINPTGKKQLTAELQAGQFTQAMAFAKEQIALGAPILDVNVGASMVDEPALLPELALALSGRFPAPLCLDTSNADATEAALAVYPGSALVNSISGEPGRMERLGPLCRKYGAPFILLPLEGRKLPATAAERIRVIETLLAQAESLGIPRRLVLVDVLALTVSSRADAARACLETIRHCADNLGLPTVMGLSNISFGLPARELLNATFLSMCMASGMAACIANPGSARIREALAASEVLLGRDAQAASFISGFSEWTPGTGAAGTPTGSTATNIGAKKAKAAGLREAVVQGDRENIVSLVEAELADGADPFALVDEKLIPGITEVGEKYEQRIYFLPQLIRSAETMQAAFDRLKPLLEEHGGAGEKPVIIMATVEGDIHDIGKNIVCLMLKNHGFEVVDLGKDVSAARIVDAAETHKAVLVGLSALMTTTMVRMRDTIELLRERNLDTRVIIGGAVITGQFAESIGADGWSTDAVEAVKLAKRLAEAAPAQTKGRLQ